MTDYSVDAPTLLVMAGGTGGHIFPGLAVADKLKAQGWHIHWLGTADRMEAEIVPAHGYNIFFINISGLRHKNLLAWVKLPFKLINALIQAIKVIKEVQPDVVLGMGGYASAPGGLAAWLMKKPLIVHEQNAAAGLTNRLLARIANKVCCAFPNAFAKNIVTEVVGNPLRSSITSSAMSDDVKTSHNILVVGGSLGAQILNQTVPQAYAELIKSTQLTRDTDKTFNVWHQTGKNKQKEVIAAYNQQNAVDEQVRVTEFIDDIGSAYQWADIVICRAGALTVSELAMAATPAIFVPLPHAVDDHQTKNAQYLVSCGGAVLMKQSSLTTSSLAKLLTELFVEPKILNTMSQAALASANADATGKVADICKQLLTKVKSNES